MDNEKPDAAKDLPPLPEQRPPAELMRTLARVEENIYDLNNRYGNTLSVAYRHDRPVLARNLLLAARNHIHDLRDVVTQIDGMSLSEALKGQWQAVRCTIEARLQSWLMQCERSVKLAMPDDDLGISAGAVALHTRFDLERFLTGI